MLANGLSATAAAPAPAAPGARHLYDLPNEILLKVLATLPCTALLPLGLTSTRLHDLARRVLRGHLLAAVGRADLRIILESYHPWAQWTEPYLYCTYLDTPGLGLEELFVSPAAAACIGGGDGNGGGGGGASLPLDTSASPPPLELIYPDANAPPLCSASSLAALMRNVYSRFRPLVPGAMAVTETRHPAGGRMPVRKGNIARRAETMSSVPSTSSSSSSAMTMAAGPSGSALSSSAPTSYSSSSIDPTGAHLAALRNASLFEDRLKTTNPNSGPDNHAFANGVVLRRQAAADDDARAAARRRGGSNASARLDRHSSLPSDEREEEEEEDDDDEEERLVSHRIRLDADEPFSQLVVQTSLVGAGPRPGVFGRLLPVNNQGVVRVKREWLAERAAQDSVRDVPAERIARTLWVDHGRDVGLRVRVKQVSDEDEEVGRMQQRRGDDEGPCCFEVLYEELLIRTAHLEEVLDRARRGELGGRANQAIVFGSFLERGWVRG